MKDRDSNWKKSCELRRAYRNEGRVTLIGKTRHRPNRIKIMKKTYGRILVVSSKKETTKSRNPSPKPSSRNLSKR
jgi:hypothetical protein